VLPRAVRVDATGDEGGVTVDEGGDDYDVRRRRIFDRTGRFSNVVRRDGGGTSPTEMAGSVWVAKVR